MSAWNLRNRPPPRTVRLGLRIFAALLLAGIFVATFTLNLNELRQEREAQEHVSRTSGWVVVQIEQELLRLLDAVTRYSHAEPEVTSDTVHQRFDLLWSRFPVALGGPEAKPALGIPGVGATLRDLFEELQALEPTVMGLQRRDAAAYHTIRNRLEAMRARIHQVVLAVLYGPDLGEVREAKRRVQEATGAYFAAMLGTAGLLVLFLLVELWRNRRVAEREHAAHLRADQASRAKSEFLANMSHELRTPLHSIIGFADLLDREDGTGQRREYLEDIRSAARHLLQIVNDLLDLARIEAGRLDLVETQFDAGQVLRGCVRLVAPRAHAGALDIALHLPDRPPAVLGDERLFRQILLNVLSNAVKFTPSGGRVDVALRVDQDGLLTEISDTGPGIAPEHIPIVLEPFGQADGSLRRQHDGVGLGLALARRFIQLHGGTLALDSAPGAGTTVSIRLPPRRLVPHAVAAAA